MNQQPTRYVLEIIYKELIKLSSGDSGNTIWEELRKLVAFIECNEKSIRSQHSWKGFLRALEQLKDPLLLSLFKQMKYEGYDPVTDIISVSIEDKYKFFQDWLNDTKKIWIDVMALCYNENTVLNIILSDNTKGKQ